MNGFERKTRPEIVEDMQAKAKNLFGNDINLAVNAVIGILIQLLSYPISLLWFGLEAVYNAMNINEAEGQDLDNLAKKIGIKRFSGQKATGEVTFEGDNGTVIPEGFQVETDEKEEKVFQTTSEVVITNGSVTVEIISVEEGSQNNVPANTITKTTEVISGIDSVTNNQQTLGGRDRESDTKLRQRYFDSLDRPGGSTTTAIRANILEETQASACIVLENVTMQVDSEGLPRKSFESIVYGGTNENIAQAIFEKKPAGIEPFGSITEIVTDSSNNNHQIKFSRATPINIYFDMDLDTNGDYPLNGNEQVTEMLVNYISSVGVGENVIYNKIIDIIFNIEGINDIIRLKIGKVPSPTSEDNIEIQSREVAETDSSNVVIA